MALAVTMNTGALAAVSRAAADLTRELELKRSEIASATGAARAAGARAGGVPAAGVLPSITEETKSKDTFRKMMDAEIRTRETQAEAQGMDVDPKLLKIFGRRAGGFGSAARLSRLAGISASMREIRGGYYGAAAMAELATGEGMPSAYHVYHAVQLPQLLGRMIGSAFGKEALGAAIGAAAMPIIGGVVSGLAIRMIPQILAQNLREEIARLRKGGDDVIRNVLFPQLRGLEETKERQREYSEYLGKGTYARQRELEQEMKRTENAIMYGMDAKQNALSHLWDRRSKRAHEEFIKDTKDSVAGTMAVGANLTYAADWWGARLKGGIAVAAEERARFYSETQQTLARVLEYPTDEIVEKLKKKIGADVPSHRLAIFDFVNQQLSQGKMDIIGVLESMLVDFDNKRNEEIDRKMQDERANAWNPNNAQERFVQRQRDRYLRVLEETEWKRTQAWNPY